MCFVRPQKRLEMSSADSGCRHQFGSFVGFPLYFLSVAVVCAGSVVRVLCRPGQTVTLPCSYHYENDTQLSQLSVQWRSPNNELLCHYIKHKSFQNCSDGYSIAYRPGSITLTIQRVRTEDFGAHVCSVSKRHEFSDYSVELDRMPGELDRWRGGAWRGELWGNRMCLFLQILSPQLQTVDGTSPVCSHEGLFSSRSQFDSVKGIFHTKLRLLCLYQHPHCYVRLYIIYNISH